MLCARRTLWISLFPQRVILTRFGRFVIHDSLVATPTRHSLISGVACELAARVACSEAWHARVWERGQLARNLARSTACTCLGARAARPQRTPKHRMHLSGSVGSLPATYLEARHVLNFYF